MNHRSSHSSDVIKRVERYLFIVWLKFTAVELIFNQ